jgi:hypothetical protein
VPNAGEAGTARGDITRIDPHHHFAEGHRVEAVSRRLDAEIAHGLLLQEAHAALRWSHFSHWRG